MVEKKLSSKTFRSYKLFYANCKLPDKTTFHGVLFLLHQIDNLKFNLMKKFVLLLLVVLSTSLSFAQSLTKRTKEFNLENKVALQGYDPVAYFTQKKAVKGKRKSLRVLKALLIIFLLKPIKKLLPKILQVTNRNMVVGVLLLWVITVKK